MFSKTTRYEKVQIALVILVAIMIILKVAGGQERIPTPPLLNASEEMSKKIQTDTCADQKQEIQRLTTLLNWYQQQFFALQARQIEQQVAPAKPSKESKAP